MTDEDGGRIMEKIEKICRSDPSALMMIENIINDLLQITDEEADALQDLYNEVIRKAREQET